MKTNAEIASWSRRYRAALRKHLKQGASGDLPSALKLGHQAVVLGLETLDVARIHQESMFALDLANSVDGIVTRSDKFFTEATTPIEKTHRAALDAGVRLGKLNKTLSRRTADLADSNRQLKQGIRRRKGAEVALKKSAGHHSKLLKESHRLQGHLRQLTHKILTAHEDKRKKISRELHDEIAQTLLGINVRLLVLKTEATSNAAGLKKEIASTQRMVEKSVKIMTRLGYGYGKNHDS